MKTPSVAGFVVLALLAGVLIGRSLPSRTAVRQNESKPAVVGSTKDSITKSGDTEAEPASETNPVDLVSELKNALSHSGTRRFYVVLTKLVDSIDANNVQEVLSFVQGLAKPREKEILMPMVLGRWAEFDPREALAFAQNTPGERERTFAVDSVLRSWAETDSHAALRRVQGLQHGLMRDQAMQTVIDAIANEDPQQALSLAQGQPRNRNGGLYASIFRRLSNTDVVAAANQAAQLPSGRGREVALETVARHWAEQDPDAALAWTNSLPAGQTRNRTLQSMLSSLADRDPAKAAAIVVALPPGSSRDQPIRDIARQWAQTDISAALNWAQQLPMKMEKLSKFNGRNTAMETIISQWSSNDPKSAVEYVLQSVEGPERNHLLASAAGFWAWNDPQEALAWANGLSDATARDSVFPILVSAVAQNDPQQAAEIVSRLSAKVQESVAGSVASGWVASDPQAASRWAASLPEGKAKERAVEELIRCWAESDSNSAFNWLAQLPKVIRGTPPWSGSAGTFPLPIRKRHCNGSQPSATRTSVTAKLRMWSGFGSGAIPTQRLRGSTARCCRTI